MSKKSKSRGKMERAKHKAAQKAAKKALYAGYAASGNNSKRKARDGAKKKGKIKQRRRLPRAKPTETFFDPNLAEQDVPKPYRTLTVRQRRNQTALKGLLRGLK